MKEIGGYFEFEKLSGREWHEGAIKLNSARNCIRYVIKKRGIKKIYLPQLYCSSIEEACQKEKVEIEFYSIDEKLAPALEREMEDGEYVLIINYYGVLNNEKLKSLKEKYKNVIVDNTQAFFQAPVEGVDVIYNCRKYFGVPDGAYLRTDLELDENLAQGKSGEKIKHLVGRLEDNAADYYADFKDAEEKLGAEEVMRMSKFTENMVGAIDYAGAEKTRKENLAYVVARLGKYNDLALDFENMTFMYPLHIKNADGLRQKLVENKIYVPVLWPNVLEQAPNSLAYDYAKNIVPIPIDQRYEIADMERVCDIIEEYLYGKE